LYPPLQHAQHVLSQSVAVPTVLVLWQCYVPDRIHVQSSFPPPLQRCRTPSPSQAHRSHSPPDLLLPLPSTNLPLVRWPIGVAASEDIMHALIEFSDRSTFMASHNGAPSFAIGRWMHRLRSLTALSLQPSSVFLGEIKRVLCAPFSFRLNAVLGTAK
jgi:hypothetical protein